MEEKMIIVNQVKSNRSEFMVWQVAITGEPFAQYCKSPLKALRFAFMLKKSKGVKISMESIATLQQEISLQKELQPEAEKKADVAEYVEVDDTWPAAKQFRSLKAKHPDAILLFREKDVYTAHCQDAEEVSEILDIVLTKSGRRNTCSFPHTALDIYLPKLVKAGKRIAICESNQEAAA
jgi:DNA mismatch repair protein MutS